MKEIFIIIVCAFSLTNGFSQNHNKLSGYLLFQYNKTLYDLTKDNNPWGTGIGFQVFLNNDSKFKPTIELTGDAYFAEELASRIVLPFLDPIDGENSVNSMINLFVGYSYQPGRTLHTSFIIGPSFINGKPFLGIKPSFGLFFLKSQKYFAKLSYINVFNRLKFEKKDFGSLSIAISRKLF
jgi:hypothetical protein